MAVAAAAIDLKQLPLRALLAYASRCARRVQPLFTVEPDKADPAAAAQAIDTAIRLGEEFAAGAELDPQLVAHAEDAVVQILMIGGSGDGLDKGAAYAANAAYGVISATRAALESEMADDPSAAAQLVTECATIVADAAMAADPGVERAARLDWEMLHRMRLGKFPALGDAINPAPTGMLGPLFCSQTRRSGDENTAGDRLTGREPPPRPATRPEPPREEEPSDSLRLDRIEPPKKQTSARVQAVLEELQERRTQLEEEREAFEVERALFKDEQQRSRSEFQSAEEKLSSREADLQRREEELQQRESALAEREQKLAEFEATLQEAGRRLDEERASLDQQRAQFEQERGQQQSSSAAGDELREQLERERSELERERTTLNEQLEQFQTEYTRFSEAVEAFQAEREKAGADTGASPEAAAELQNARVEKEQLQKRLQVLQQEFERAERERQELAQQVEQLRSAPADSAPPSAPQPPAPVEPRPQRRPAVPIPHIEAEREAVPLRLLVEPGTATSMQLAELFHEMNTLYRQLGGDGIRFQVTDSRVWSRGNGAEQRRSIVELRAAPAPPPGGLLGEIDPVTWEQMRSCLVMAVNVDEGLTACFAESQSAPEDSPAARLVASAAKRAMTAYAARRNDGNSGGALPIDAVNLQVKRIEQFIRALERERHAQLEIATAELSASGVGDNTAGQTGGSDKQSGWWRRWRS